MSIKQVKARCARFVLGSLCLLGLFFFLSFRSLTGTAAPAAQSDRTFSIRVEVELVTAEVIALDEKGKPVRNLKKEDFRLYEDGKQQEIASFDVLTEEDAPAMDLTDGGRAVPRGKAVLILFDDSTITAAHIKTTRDSAEKFVKEHMGTRDVFAIASYDLSLRVLQGFTGDPEKILAAIRLPAVSGSGRRASANTTTMGAPQPSSRQNTSDTSSSDPLMRYQSESFFRALDALSRSVERVRGRKSILIFSEDLPLSDESRSLYSKTLNSARKANVVFYAIDAKGLGSEDVIGEIQNPVKEMRPPRTIATTGGGTGGSGTGGVGSAGSSGTGSGSTSNPSYNRRQDSTANDPWASNPDFGSRSNRMEKDILKSFSSETGGFSIFNTGNFDQELAKLDQQLSNYYVLGFQSNNPKRDGSLRKLEVKTDLKGVTLRYRKGYVDRRPLDTLASSKEEKFLLDAMASPASALKLPLAFRAIYFYDSPRLARVLVSSKIRMDKAEFKKRGEQLSCDLNVMGVAYAENDTVAARFSETVPVLIDKDKAQNLPKALAYSNYFKLRPGKYRLKLAVSDGARNLGSMEQVLEIPVPPDNGFAASSLVVAEQVSHLPALIQNIQATLLDNSDPLVYSGMQISPSIENRVQVNSPLAVLFKLYNPAGGLDRWKAIVKAKLLGEAGKELTLPPISLENDASQSQSTEATLGCTLRFKDVMPGKYRLVIETTELQSSLTATVQTDLELVAN